MAHKGQWMYLNEEAVLTPFPLNSPHYERDRWYVVKIHADYVKGSYDVWIDAQQVGHNIPMASENSYLAGILIQPASISKKGEMWVDDIFLSRESWDDGPPAGSARVSNNDGNRTTSPPVPVTDSMHNNETLPNTLAGARAFPVPWEPGRGASGITFDQLPEDISIKIFSIDGRIVKTLTTNNTERVQWGLTDEGGSAVAGGVYAAVMEKEGNRKTIKLVIQR